MSKRKPYTFTLTGVKPDEIDKQYGFKTLQQSLQGSETFIPCESTKISELHTFTQTLTVVDELKNVHNARVSTVLPAPNASNTHLHCFWDRHPLGHDAPVYCPVEKMHAPQIKAYVSEINHKAYKIQDSMQPTAYEEYYVDGVFCSVECCLAFIDAHRTNPLYQHSEVYLREIFALGDQKCAPHWRLLTAYGGNLSIDDFRKSFTNTHYTPDGVVYHPLCFLYRENYHL
jgi:hypothetical protein